MKGTMMRSIAKKILAFGLAGCMAVVGLAGCSQPQAEEEAPAAVEEEQPTYDLIIGAEDDAVVNFPMTNGIESVITGLQVKDVASADFSANLMTSGQEWEPGQIADVFFAGVLITDAEDGAADSSAASSAAGTSGTAAASDAADAAALEDLILNASYDLQLTMADGTTAVLHQLNLGSLMDAEDITIAVDAASGAAYLTYVEDDASASTLDAELQLIAEQEAALAAAAEAEAAAAAAAQNANQSQSSGSGGDGSYDSIAPSGGSGSGGSAPSQSEDACVAPDDLVFN